MAFQRRVRRLFVLAALGLIAVGGRTWHLQGCEHDTWVAAATAKRQRVLEIAAPRGRILDRHGRVLAVDKPIYQLALVAWDWTHAARVRCPSCGTIHFHDPEERPPRRCSCGTERAHFETLPAPDPARLEDLLELERGELARMARDRLAHIEKLAAGKKRALEAAGQADFLLYDGVRQYRRDLMHRPKVIVRRIPREALRLVELDEVGEFRGFRVRPDLRRHYPEGGPTGQLLGYVSVVQHEEELESYRDRYGRNVTLDTRVGRAGLEKALEELLLGRVGWELQERDENGAFTVTVDEERPARGKEVELALSTEACLQAEEILGEYDKPELYYPGTRASGGFVAMYADTGAVVAWGEMPRLDIEQDLARMFHEAESKAFFDPALGQWRLPDDVHLRSGDSMEEWLRRLSQPAPRHLSRVSQIPVEPGSTFKLFTGLGLLDGLRYMPPGTLLPYEHWYECHGRSSKPRCHAHRPIGFEGAIEVSCNPYFSFSVRKFPRYWNVYRKSIPALLGRMGFGQPTGVDLWAEDRGRLLNDWIDFDFLAVAQGALAKVQKARNLPTEAVGFRLHGNVPRLVAGRGEKRLAEMLEKVLDAAAGVAGDGRVVLNITGGEKPARFQGIRFEVYAQPHPEGPAPEEPDLEELRASVGRLGGQLEMDVRPPGIYTFSFTLHYHEPIGRKAGDPLEILPDDGRVVAIGQGPVTVTPLQMVRAVSAFANGGRLVTPHLAVAADGVALTVPSQDLHLDPAHIERIRNGMRAVVTGHQGTASKGAWGGVAAEVYGKTGTAQVGGWWKPQGDPDDSEGPWHHWFVGFAERPGMRPLAFACVLHSRMESAASRTAVHAACSFLTWWYGQGPDVR